MAQQEATDGTTLPPEERLDFDSFCGLAKQFETNERPLGELVSHFAILAKGRGWIHRDDYLHYILRDDLSKQVATVVSLFEAWDEDGNGTIDEREWRWAIRALGYGEAYSDRVITSVFQEFDADGSGGLNYRELMRRIRMHSGQEAGNRIALRREMKGRRGAALATTVQFDRAEDSPSIQEQLRDALAENLVRVIDLFRDWDDNTSGMVDMEEFFRGMRALGLVVSREESDAAFAEIDSNGNGSIEYDEIHRHLRGRKGGLAKLKREEAARMRRSQSEGMLQSRGMQSQLLRRGRRDTNTRSVQIPGPAHLLRSRSSVSVLGPLAMSRSTWELLESGCGPFERAPVLPSVNGNAQMWCLPRTGQARLRKAPMPDIHPRLPSFLPGGVPRQSRKIFLAPLKTLAPVQKVLDDSLKESIKEFE